MPIGLLCNGTHLRLVYAPRGETSGYMTFAVAEMAQVAGRPIFAALHMLLSTERLFSLAENQRLPAILADSRKYQNVVSTQLAEQVLAALYELLRGFQAADDQRHGELLREILAKDPNHVYAGLLTVLMRLVFILYAEDRDLLSNDPLYVNYYSITGLFERLRADAGQYPDTMDQRYGAWAQLLTLVWLIYEGGSHGNFQIPARKGYLFDPDRYPFLEGQPHQSPHTDDERINIPRVSDGVVFRVLSNLLILDGERLSYRTLDVEQIGSVYEAVMGFNLKVADGPSIAIKPAKAHGAPTTINLQALLAAKSADRVKWLRDHTDQQLTGRAAESLKNAATIDDLLAALEAKTARKVTPNLVPKGAMVLQPSDERRRSGSHYTPRSLTEPIVRTTLKPVLEQLGEQPTPEQLLDLKVCDPAMGSGAFLVEACRQLGDQLVKVWHIHQCVPKLPPDEDEVLHVRRLIAQRCLYGVDKNPMAVDLSKLSLWLATLAKDHPFTFLDHSLRYGDSLVGLSREQIEAFHWEGDVPRFQAGFETMRVREHVEKVAELRQRIREADETVSDWELRDHWDEAQLELRKVRLFGDLVLTAFFHEEKPKEREAKRGEYTDAVVSGEAERYRSWLEECRHSDRPLAPFHWEIEFPEVFARKTKGFDAILGNPPFLKGNQISRALGPSYQDWTISAFAAAGGQTDLVAYFFQRAYALLRVDGCLGLLATQTISQGDSRRASLELITSEGGVIYCAVRRLKWAGHAAVTVSRVHVHKQPSHRIADCILDGRKVSRISAFLFSLGEDSLPSSLSSNSGIAFKGFSPYGIGFTFDDKRPDATPLSEMRRLTSHDPHLQEAIFPYLGGEEMLEDPRQHHRRYAICFRDMSEEDTRAQYPQLMAIVEEKVKPVRMKDERKRRREKWWLYGEQAPGLEKATTNFQRLLMHPYVSSYLAFAFVPATTMVAAPHYAFALDTFASFAALQSRVHEVWVRFFASSLEDRITYTATACFGTFPFSVGWTQDARLEATGQSYYECRAALMVRNDEGLTMTYNRFHDPDERAPDILRLRELRAAMDQAVLETYGWHDLAEEATCEFLLDYEDDDEDEEESADRRTRRKPWRYRWPDDFRDEVLARLLELNKQRAEQERLAGLSAEATSTNSRKRAHSGKKPSKAKKRQSDQTTETAHPNLPGITT
jgi:hypothetical protein